LLRDDCHASEISRGNPLIYGLIGTVSAKSDSRSMDRQNAFRAWELYFTLWSASGAPPVDRADRNSGPEAKAILMEDR